MKLEWTSDAYAHVPGVGTYRITLNDHQFELGWLPVSGRFWQRVTIEDDLAQARMTASVHAGLSDEDRGTALALGFRNTMLNPRS